MKGSKFRLFSTKTDKSHALLLEFIQLRNTVFVIQIQNAQKKIILHIRLIRARKKKLNRLFN